MNRPIQIGLTLGTPMLALMTSLLPMPLLGADILQPAVAEAAPTSMATRIYQKASPSVVTIKNGSGHGSGFVISADGLIITNAHVVADGPRVVTVLFSDGRQTSADVIGFAKGGVDLAVLRLYDQQNLPFLSLAAPGSVNVGEQIFVIGTPLDQHYQNTLSVGIVSRLDPKQGVIQHNADTNPGNSGGPVLNSQGQVIGVHFAGVQASVYSDARQPLGVTKTGINFAISLDRLQSFVTAVRQGATSPVSTLPQPPEPASPTKLAMNNQRVQGALAETDQQLADGSFYDLYQFQGQAGQRITLDLESDDINPYLGLYRVSESGTFAPIAVNDDRGPADFNAQLNVQLDANDTYYVMANTISVGATGRYTLQASTTP